jgi:hypothetical protein
MRPMAGAITSTVEDRFFLVGVILLLAVVAGVVARRLSIPVLVFFLGLGMLLGSDGPGGIYFDDASLARTIVNHRPGRDPLRGRSQLDAIYLSTGRMA